MEKNKPENKKENKRKKEIESERQKKEGERTGQQHNYRIGKCLTNTLSNTGEARHYDHIPPTTTTTTSSYSCLPLHPLSLHFTSLYLILPIRYFQCQV